MYQFIQPLTDGNYDCFKFSASANYDIMKISVYIIMSCYFYFHREDSNNISGLKRIYIFYRNI